MDESEIKKLLLELEKRKGTGNQQLSMYSDLPKRTFVKKEKPPFGLKIFKVWSYFSRSSLIGKSAIKI